jgi:DNA-binding NarL/FixJ family response regulator
MPDMTGLEVQQSLAARGKRFPVLVYTADDAPEAQARYLAAGAADYLRKPLGSDELLAAVARAVSGAERISSDLAPMIPIAIETPH